MKILEIKLGAVVHKMEGGDVSKKCVQLEELQFILHTSVLDPEHSYFDQS